MTVTTSCSTSCPYMNVETSAETQQAAWPVTSAGQHTPRLTETADWLSNIPSWLWNGLRNIRNRKTVSDRVGDVTA